MIIAIALLSITAYGILFTKQRWKILFWVPMSCVIILALMVATLFIYYVAMPEHYEWIMAVKTQALTDGANQLEGSWKGIQILFDFDHSMYPDK